MTPALIVHIGAGCLEIVSGFAAISLAKGERLHRSFGSAFFLGQRRIIPAFLNTWPLLVPALAPLAVMSFWLLRVRLTDWLRSEPPAA
jgi:hypothetical protein